MLSSLIVSPEVPRSLARPRVAHTRLLAEAGLEPGPLVLDGVLPQMGLQALESVVHHVHFHQAQNLEDPPDRENSILYEANSVRGAPTQRAVKSWHSRIRRGFKTNSALPPLFTEADMGPWTQEPRPRGKEQQSRNRCLWTLKPLS